MRAARWTTFLTLVTLLSAAEPRSSDWVPMRWPWTDVASLELLADSPFNCLLVKSYSPQFTAAAAKRGLVVLAVIGMKDDAVEAARNALAAGAKGIVLEGSFPEATVAAVQRASANAPVIRLTPRSSLSPGSAAPVFGTYQGVFPGIAIEQNGVAKAGPTGSTWIDTNTGFLRAVRASGDVTFWIANEPPPRTILTGRRYLQVIAEAAVSGARWVLALDDDFSVRLNKREPAVVRDWRLIGEVARYFEGHPEWRRMRPYGKLAVIQDPMKGGLLSGGILDMLAAKHIPARLIPPHIVTAEALRGATVVLNMEPGRLGAAQEKALRVFAQAGGTRLNGPHAWQEAAAMGERFEVNGAEIERLEPVWNELNSKLTRKDYDVRLFNVSSMISTTLISGDSKTMVVHLVNYSDYPVEAISVMFPDNYGKATLFAPGEAARALEISRSGGGAVVTLDRVSVCATLELAH